MTNWNRVNNELSEAVLAADALEELLAELRCDPRGTAGGWRGRCPAHGGEDFNFVVREGDDLPVLWACHSHHCERRDPLKPSLLGLVRGALGDGPERPATMGEAVAFLRAFIERLGTPSAPRPARPAKAPTPAGSGWAPTRAEVRQRLVIPSPYFLGRGFSPAVLDRFDVGYSAKLGRSVAPVYDRDGVYAGFVSRSTKPLCGGCGWCHPPDAPCGRGEPRWQFPPDFPKRFHLFNHEGVALSPTRSVLLVEGVPDVLRAAEAGVDAVACFGTDLSDPQQVAFEVLGKRVVVAFDNDGPGRAAAAEVARRLGRACPVEVRHPPAGYKDVGDMPAAEVARWYGR
jgi:hypothetical protein